MRFSTFFATLMATTALAIPTLKRSVTTTSSDLISRQITTSPGALILELVDNLISDFTNTIPAAAGNSEAGNQDLLTNIKTSIVSGTAEIETLLAGISLTGAGAGDTTLLKEAVSELQTFAGAVATIPSGNSGITPAGVVTVIDTLVKILVGVLSTVPISLGGLGQ